MRCPIVLCPKIASRCKDWLTRSPQNPVSRQIGLAVYSVTESSALAVGQFHPAARTPTPDDTLAGSPHRREPQAYVSQNRLVRCTIASALEAASHMTSSLLAAEEADPEVPFGHLADSSRAQLPAHKRYTDAANSSG